MERKEAYEQIKKLGLQGECQKKYGKNFTQCKTSELEVIINAAKKKEGSKARTKVLTEAKPVEDVTKATDKTGVLKESFIKLLITLKKRHILLESDVKEILG